MLLRHAQGKTVCMFGILANIQLTFKTRFENKIVRLKVYKNNCMFHY